ncbi:hypothetical protein QCA50_003869 [Cerrena zonata]|uniref:Uncharacterized protein n=1 Tax=Cerrena zonata TaxID=2478898 RepID=A0AAW0GRR1_9APHY
MTGTNPFVLVGQGSIVSIGRIRRQKLNYFWLFLPSTPFLFCDYLYVCNRLRESGSLPFPCSYVDPTGNSHETGDGG